MSRLILGLDMGTTSISAVAVDEFGRVVRSVTKAHYAAVEGLPAEYAEQDPSRIRSAAFDALRMLCRSCSGSEFIGVALTGQMHSTVLLDEEFHVVGNVVTWQDRRSLASEENGTLLSELQHRATDASMFQTGCRLSSGYLGTTIFSMRRLKQLNPKVRHLSFVADWIGSVLTERPPVTERSHAASSGLYDLVADDWSDSLLQAAEIPRAWLPVVRDSGAIAGTLSEASASSLGLKAGLPIFNAIGDNQASVLSALPDVEGSILINIGTGGQIVWRVPAFARQLPLDTRVLPGNPDRNNGRAMPQFMIVGAGLCGGDAIAWVNRTVRQWLADFGVVLSEEALWEKLQTLVQLQQDSKDLICEPFFRGTRYEPDRRGLIQGISTDNFLPGNLLISVLDGIAQSMFDIWKNSPESHSTPLRRVAMAGNAVKHNPLLVKAVQRRFGVPVVVSRHTEEAATGATMIAGVHLRVWSTIEDARSSIEQSTL